MRLNKIPRPNRQSDDPVWQAVAVKPGEFPWPLWYNLHASANTTEVRKLDNLLSAATHKIIPAPHGMFLSLRVIMNKNISQLVVSQCLKNHLR